MNEKSIEIKKLEQTNRSLRLTTIGMFVTALLTVFSSLISWTTKEKISKLENSYDNTKTKQTILSELVNTSNEFKVAQHISDVYTSRFKFNYIIETLYGLNPQKDVYGEKMEQSSINLLNKRFELITKLQSIPIYFKELSEDESLKLIDIVSKMENRSYPLPQVREEAKRLKEKSSSPMEVLDSLNIIFKRIQVGEQMFSDEFYNFTMKMNDEINEE